MAQHVRRSKRSDLRDNMPAWDVYYNGKRISQARLFQSESNGIAAITTNLWKDSGDEIGKYFLSGSGSRKPMPYEFKLRLVREGQQASPTSPAQLTTISTQETLFDLSRDAIGL